MRSAALVASIAAAVCAVSAQPTPPQLRVTLLGTGNPTPRLERFGPSILVEAGSTRLLFDAGRGALQRLHQLDRGDCAALFLTHLHSDHVVGIPDLWLTGWLTEGRTGPLHVWGPAGTAAMMDHLRQAFAFDIGFRISDDRKSPEGARPDVHDIVEGVVYEANGITVTAFDVDHRPIVPALGYRIDFAGRSVVLSGDTRFSEHLIAMAKGADLLVHEVGGRQDVRVTQANNNILAHHTMPDQAGEVFARVRPKLAVYSHIVGDLSDQELVSRTRRTYAGPLVVGKDLMAFDVGTAVTVIDDATKTASGAAAAKK